MQCERLFGLYVKSQQPPERAELGTKSIGSRRYFYKELAHAIVDKDWVSSTGASISLPCNHFKEAVSSPALQASLEGLSLVDTATVLK